MVEILFNYEGIIFNSPSDKEKLKYFILYPSKEFFSQTNIVTSPNEAQERLIEISFHPFDPGYYFPPEYFKKHEVIVLPQMALKSQAGIVCASYHEFYHAGQYHRGVFKSIYRENKEEMRKLELDAYKKTLDYAVCLPQSIWQDDAEKKEFLDMFSKKIKYYSVT